MLLIGRAAVRQRRALGRRIPVTHPAWCEALERLAKRAGIRHPVRLSSSALASTPLVIGRREVCLPERALELDRDALEAVLAHELAHIQRRDAEWLSGALFAQALLWFQPLQRKVTSELRESAELAADDRAIELTNDPLGLARTLTQVASWLGGTPLRTSVAMARPGSPIVERVARLVEASDAPAGARLRSRTPWPTLAVLAAIGACSPSVGAPRVDTPHAGLESHPRQPDAAPAELAANASTPGATSEPAPGSVPPHPVQSDAPQAPADASDPAKHGSTTKGALDRARHLRDVARQRLAQLRHPASPNPSLPPPPMPEFPMQGMVSDIVSGVVPRAVEFSQRIAQLAMNEVELEQRIERAEAAAAEPGASPETRDELARLKRERTASNQERQRLEQDFEARMEAWSKDFEQRFEREHGQRMAAWGEEFGRRMAAMGKDLERQLAPLRTLSIPEPPPVITPPAPPHVPQLTPTQPGMPPAPPAPPRTSPPPAPVPPAPR
jgi:hypothetical protein